MSVAPSGRVAVVTGGTGGIGGAIAQRLAEAGADVVVGSRRAGAGRANGVAEYELDIRCANSVTAFFDTVREQHGSVDILIAAAGTCVGRDLASLSDAEWDEEIVSNLTGTFRCIRAVLPGMMERGWGRIVTIASDIAHLGSADYPAYAAAKAAVVSLTRSAGLTGARCNVACNTISPGWVDTDMARGAITQLAKAAGDDPEALMAELTRLMPRNRLVEPDEIASLAVYLCREGSGALTMQDISVDGGARWYLDRLATTR